MAGFQGNTSQSVGKSKVARAAKRAHKHCDKQARRLPAALTGNSAETGERCAGRAGGTDGAKGGKWNWKPLPQSVVAALAEMAAGGRRGKRSQWKMSSGRPGELVGHSRAGVGADRGRSLHGGTGGWGPEDRTTTE